MAVVNYASKYATQIDERFSREAMSNPAINQDYDFVGVQTVNVYSVPTAKMNDYQMSGSSRYGTPEELGNTVQEMTMQKDRSFTFTIDRRNYTDTQMANSAGAALQRQLREVVIPEVDTYRFKVICENAGKVAVGTVTKDNAYSVFLDGTEALTDAKVPITGASAFVSSRYYKLIKEDSSFVKQSDKGQDIALKGQVGTIDGITVIVLAKSYLPDGVDFFITNKIATTAPVKLSEYKIHEDPPGIDGWLVEGRVYYDAFVLNSKKDAIYVHKSAAASDDTEDETPETPELGVLNVTSTASETSGKTVITVSPEAASGNSLVYKVNASTPAAVTYGKDLSSWTELPAGGEIEASSGSKITVAEVDAESKAVKAGSATVVSGE